MERVALFFKLKPNKKDEYIKRHAKIWPEMTEVLDVAGFRNYSIWNHEDMLFAYYEIKNRKRGEEILSKSEIYAKWRDEMSDYIWCDSKSGQKEWFMKKVFLHE